MNEKPQILYRFQEFVKYLIISQNQRLLISKHLMGLHNLVRNDVLWKLAAWQMGYLATQCLPHQYLGPAQAKNKGVFPSVLEPAADFLVVLRGTWRTIASTQKERLILNQRIRRVLGYQQSNFFTGNQMKIRCQQGVDKKIVNKNYKKKLLLERWHLIMQGTQHEQSCSSSWHGAGGPRDFAQKLNKSAMIEVSALERN